MRRQRRSSQFWVDFFACFFLPAYTLLFAGSVAWFGTNFSVLAVTGPKYYRGFLLWGILAGGYFLAILWNVGKRQLDGRGRWVLRGLTVAACACLACALVVPYLPEDFPRYAKLHVLLAFVACVLLMAALLWALLYGVRRQPGRYKKMLRAWWLIAVGSGVIFALGGMVTSALEVFFTISTGLLARKLWLCGEEQG